MILMQLELISCADTTLSNLSDEAIVLNAEDMPEEIPGDREAREESEEIQDWTSPILITDSQIPLEETGKKDGFVFFYNGTAIYLGEYSERILGELGSAMDYQESDVCTADGIMKTYYYGGFDFSTYEKNSIGESAKSDRIFSISLTDDSVSTAEGIYIGQTVDEMIAAYGMEYEEMPGFYYRYIKDGVGLSFDIDDDIIIAITYQLINID